MRKLLFILFCLTMSYYAMAQEKVKQKEIGLVFSNLDKFGLTFKTGTDKSLWRCSLFISGSNSENMDKDPFFSGTKNGNLGFGVKVGKEYLKNVTDNLELRFGADISFALTKMNRDKDDSNRIIGIILTENFEEITYTRGINLVFGFNYKLGDKFVIGAEILPHFSYSTGFTIEKGYYGPNSNYNFYEKNDFSESNYGLSNNSVLLSLAYRF